MQHRKDSSNWIRAYASRLVGAGLRPGIRLAPLVLALCIQLAAPTIGHGATLIGRADLHVDGNTMIALAISQNGYGCGTNLSGQVCLLYTVYDVSSNMPEQVGYGLIPTTDVKSTGSSISLNTDVSTNPNFHVLAGMGGPISVTWKALPGSSPVVAGNKSGSLSAATVTGNVLNYTVGSGATGGMLIYTG